jgi:penicillin-binding protein 1C
MRGVSGVTGAGPLFRGAMMAASRLRPPHPFARPEGLEEAEICSLSGERPTARCPHRRRELFVRGDGKGGAPTKPCSMHEAVRIDRRTSLRAGPGCADAVVDERVFEVFGPPFAAWARTAGRSLAPEQDSPLCPGASAARFAKPGSLRIAYPLDGARFAVDPGLSSRQAIRVRADVPEGTARARFVLDGRAVDVRTPFVLDVPLTPGAHRVRIEADGAPPSDTVEFEVE